MPSVRNYLPDPVKNVLRPIYSRYESVFYKLSLPYYRFLDRYKLNNLDKIYDEEYFQKRKSHPWSTTTEVVVEILSERYEPNSVIDVGCAIGYYLKEFEERGADIYGIEGANRAVKNAVVDDILHADLREPVSISHTSELVTCFEVAEHLHPMYADQLVDTIAQLTEPEGMAIISAAPPGQHGTHHLNLQPKTYWIEKFESRKFEFRETETNNLKLTVEGRLNERDLPWYASSNLMVYEKH
ncbi:class I SAM-dependent methyltransferase [Haloarcula marismortui]|uniref:class I SAM-dependent methyltransferase n=1 Tax=Haloarcula marismortui TaxID=2238 RepID=UPI0009B5A23B|nr:methyltransferase domain-containing protein [Haloarcula californiae]